MILQGGGCFNIRGGDSLILIHVTLHWPLSGRFRVYWHDDRALDPEKQCSVVPIRDLESGWRVQLKVASKKSVDQKAQNSLFVFQVWGNMVVSQDKGTQL